MIRLLNVNMKNAKEIILYRAYFEMRAEASSGFFGMLLWVIEPTLYLGAFYLVFEVLDIRGGSGAVPFLLVGLIVWKWFASAVYRGAVCIERESSVIQQIHVPKVVFLSASLIFSFYQFLIVFVLLLLFLLVSGLPLTLSWGWLPVVIGVQFLLVASVAAVFAVFVPFVQDIKVVLANGLTLLFFLSGIFFDISTAGAPYRDILYLNPMASVIDAYRAVLLEAVAPDLTALLIVGGFSTILLMISVVLMRRWDREYPKVLQ